MSNESTRAPERGRLAFEDLRAANLPRCENDFGHKLESWSVAEWMCAALGELGEAANIAKKMLRHRDGVAGNKGEDRDLAMLREKLGRELADSIIYVDLCAASQGIDLGSVVVETFNRKSEEIGSPVRLSVNTYSEREALLRRAGVVLRRLWAEPCTENVGDRLWGDLNEVLSDIESQMGGGK